MTSVGVTGHQMRDGIDWAWVRSAIGRVLAEEDGADRLWTCLATGADTIAAEEALDRGLKIMAVIPHRGYEDVFSDGDRKRYRALIAQTERIVRLDRRGDNETAYLEAGHRVADESDLLLVVWDGLPAAGKGGTGDVAAYARARGARVMWLDTTRSTTRSLSEAGMPDR